ncbi:MAG: hypothetical protein WC745_05430 [Patescibacteria group bacterium]|jgi:hypothetical protein
MINNKNMERLRGGEEINPGDDLSADDEKRMTAEAISEIFPNGKTSINHLGALMNEEMQAADNEIAKLKGLLKKRRDPEERRGIESDIRKHEEMADFYRKLDEKMMENLEEEFGDS